MAIMSMLDGIVINSIMLLLGVITLSKIWNGNRFFFTVSCFFLIQPSVAQEIAFGSVEIQKFRNLQKPSLSPSSSITIKCQFFRSTYVVANDRAVCFLFFPIISVFYNRYSCNFSAYIYWGNYNRDGAANVLAVEAQLNGDERNIRGRKCALLFAR